MWGDHAKKEDTSAGHRLTWWHPNVQHKDEQVSEPNWERDRTGVETDLDLTHQTLKTELMCFFSMLTSQKVETHVQSLKTLKVCGLIETHLRCMMSDSSEAVCVLQIVTGVDVAGRVFSPWCSSTAWDSLDMDNNRQATPYWRAEVYSSFKDHRTWRCETIFALVLQAVYKKKCQEASVGLESEAVFTFSLTTFVLQWSALNESMLYQPLLRWLVEAEDSIRCFFTPEDQKYRQLLKGLLQSLFLVYSWITARICPLTEREREELKGNTVCSDLR